MRVIMTEKELAEDEGRLKHLEDEPKIYIPENKQAKKERRVRDKGKAFDEKYRPEDLSEIIGQNHIYDILHDLTKKDHFNHMIFIGPPGVGKTSVARVLARELLGSNWKLNFQEFNVPNGNNDLNFINKDLINFIQNRPIQKAPFRIVFLDECDDLTRDAQSALRKILEDEKYKYVRFIFATNYSEKLISQLQGERIRVLHFKKIPNHIFEAYLEKICEDEGITYEGDALKVIVENANGSLRNGLGNIDFLRDINNHISLQRVKNYISYIEPSDVKELLQRAIDKKDYVKCLDQLTNDKNLSVPKILQEVINVINDMELEPNEKSYIIDQLGLYSWRISQSSDHMLQMRCFLNSLANMPTH